MLLYLVVRVLVVALTRLRVRNKHLHFSWKHVLHVFVGADLTTVDAYLCLNDSF